MNHFLQNILDEMPEDWLNLTTHRLDIYNEDRAKVEFLEQLEKLFSENRVSRDELSVMPTAYDYIRLGHPLSSVMEWAYAKRFDISPERVISFASSTMPILAILRTNKLRNKATRIVFKNHLPKLFDQFVLKSIYGFRFEIEIAKSDESLKPFVGSTVYVDPDAAFEDILLREDAEFQVFINRVFGSILVIRDGQNADYVGEIQHVRRRESIAMTPANCHKTLQLWVGKTPAYISDETNKKTKESVLTLIKRITHTSADPLVASSGLSVQYAIMMGLVHHAKVQHPNRPIHIIVPPNCYGGTNDQARRVAAAVEGVEIVDLPVDGDNDMVKSTELVLNHAATADAVPLIIAEIPTNPRVEVPDLDKLVKELSVQRKTPDGKNAVEPIFILDQTFCPNVNFLGENQIFSTVQTIAYVSGSKFPSGGKCTAGYCAFNQRAEYLRNLIEAHLELCDNSATDLQMQILSEQLPSMIDRIAGAYANTQEFVDFIREKLPEAKINFVSPELAQRGFTPSVFSLDLPTRGETHQEREMHKRRLNMKLIEMMITQIPDESKYCVSYGQLKGCYWTIPATSTQGTTKESDKDYIARVSVSPDLDLKKHKEVFVEFVNRYIYGNEVM